MTFLDTRQKAAPEIGRPTVAHRVMLTIAAVELAGGFAWFFRHGRGDLGQGTDLTPILVGVRAVLAGLNPYAADPDQPLLYPFTALVLLAPAAYAAISPAILDAIWSGTSAGLLTWAVTRDRLWSPALLMVCSPAMFQSIQVSQWTPLLLALTLLSRGSGFVYACKPSTALWLFTYRPTWRAVGEGAALLAVSLALWPGWPLAWVHGLSEARWSISLLTVPGGALLLLALLRWRLPEARMLVVMACAPQTPLLYETLPLGLIPQTWMQGGVLWIGMLVARFGALSLGQDLGTSAIPALAVWMVWCVYLPALAILLWSGRSTLRRAGSGTLDVMPSLLAFVLLEIADWWRRYRSGHVEPTPERERPLTDEERRAESSGWG